ncbi:MAG: FAD-dependent oxidoreductase, partial [Candidatus Cloacimonadaceae bacterium]|nr:FAD-dependent oxidoreductase [Candidatus Cloacimonadaceae bacterium]
MISDGMQINTDTDDIKKARKMALELLISNHYADCEAPCKVACPDHVDIQSYVSLIANGQYHEAVKVIKDTLPMPLSIGRVCPAFCEKECRRQIVEEPVAIRQLKRYAADEDLNDFWNYIPEKLPENGKKIAIIGAGPSGLTCGYYLSSKGYDVLDSEASPAEGCWLSYGIPEYRLPKAILDKEVDLMCANGMKIEYNKLLGKDVFLNELSQGFDAVYLAIGAQKAVPMPVKGSDLHGCYLGVDFLKDHAMGIAPSLGKRVAVVGGGNTAIDCARTALRLGSAVTLIYRRTKEEMPADSFEIEAAEKEGVRFHYLSNPIEYLGEDGKLCEVKIETMRLGEPDSSGRRRPEPTGEFFTEPFDSIIAAISQVPDVEAFTDSKNYIGDSILPISRWQTAIVDESTMHTGLANVFAGGDFRRGAATAIEAIADGRTAADMIDQFLQGKGIKPTKPRFDAKKGKKTAEISATEFSIFEKAARIHMPELEIPVAKSSFTEVELGYTEAQAQAEATRCLECGCQVNETCYLRQYCTDYEVDPLRFIGSIGKHPIDYTHPFIVRDQNKCINCGRCIRTCAEIQGAAVLGYIYRGFPTVVAPQFGDSLTNTNCESCGKCINVCPVGALTERNMNYKMNPLIKAETIQSCGLCGTGCVIKTEVQTTTLTRITTPEEDEGIGFNGRNLCFKGRFGWQALYSKDRIRTPLQKTPDGYQEITWPEVGKLIAGQIQNCQNKRFEISPYASLEEMLIVQSAANSLGAKFSATGYKPLFSDHFIDIKATENAYDKLEKYDEYVVVGEISHTLRTLLRLRQRQGKKLLLVAHPESAFSRFADSVISSLAQVQAHDKQLFIYNVNHLAEQDMYRIWKLAYGADPVLQNILVTSDYPNYYGFLAIKPDMNLPAASDFVFSYGYSPQRKEGARFSVAVLTHPIDNCDSDIILPMPAYTELDATALANGAQICRYHNPLKSDIFNQIMKLFYELGWMHPNSAESNYWNQMASLLIQEVAKRSADTFEPALVDAD